MKRGVAKLPVIPVRGEASHRSEQVTQLLYGEEFEVIQEKGEFYKIKMAFDGYEGYISTNQFAETENCDKPVVITSVAFPVPEQPHLQLSPGSEVCKKAVTSLHSSLDPPELMSTLQLFLGVPYLWGGRSIWGIDCSGFVQVAAKMHGRKLPRDASQQIEEGDKVNFSDSRLGDLAFFEENGKITHVGIVLSDNRIVHASGSVRIDTLTSDGIQKSDSEKTHNLVRINRVQYLFG